MTRAEEHRMETNMETLAHVALNLRSLASECPDERAELNRSASLIQRAYEALEETMAGVTR